MPIVKFSGTIARVVLYILSFITLIMGLLMLAIGSMLRAVPGKFVVLTGILNNTMSLARQVNIEIPNITEDIVKMPLLADIGTVVIIFGVLIIAISSMGLIALVCKLRLCLVALIVVLSLCILATNTVFGLIFTQNSELNQLWESQLVRKVRQEFKEVEKGGNLTGDAFSAVVNVLQLQLECCGSNGPDDYKPNPVPRSCCLKDIIHYNESDGYNAALADGRKRCIDDRKPNKDDIKSQGCYRKLHDAVFKLTNGGTVAAIFFLGNLLVVTEIVCAVLILWDMSRSAVAVF